MGKKLQYVSDFAFPSDCGFSGSAGQQMIKGYARGGQCDAGYAKGGKKVVEKATKEVYPSRRAMVKHESMETPRMKKEEVMQSQTVRGKAPSGGPGMLRTLGALGIRDNVNPGERRGVPVAPREPMLPMAKGGLKKAMATKMPKVMGEFKSGKLHSGSKKGPVVNNPKQAVAIAMSEARKMAKTKA